MSIRTTDGESKLFPQKFVDGCGSIDELYRHPKFRKKLRSFCYRYHFRVFAGTYGPEDLYQDSCLKVWKCRSKFLKPGNIMNEEEFFGWLFMVTRSQYYSRIRQLNRLRNNGLSPADTPIEELEIAAPDEGNERKYFLNRFLDFIEQYPEERQSVLKFWLQGYSYREVAMMLKSTSFKCSHVTIGNWVTASLDAFRKSLGAEISQPTVAVSGAETKHVVVPRFHQSVAGR